MKKVNKHSSNLNQSNDVQAVTFSHFDAYPNDVYILQPQKHVEDPLTGELYKFLYGYKTNWDFLCPICHHLSQTVLMLRTKFHLIISCKNCEHFTWLSIKAAK